MTDVFREAHERMTAEAFEAAVAGTHGFVIVDIDAPMRTMDLESHRPKVRMSPDVWRRIMAAPSPLFEPLSLAYEPLPEPDPRFVFDVSPRFGYRR